MSIKDLVNKAKSTANKERLRQHDERRLKEQAELEEALNWAKAWVDNCLPARLENAIREKKLFLRISLDGIDPIYGGEGPHNSSRKAHALVTALREHDLHGEVKTSAGYDIMDNKYTEYIVHVELG